MTRPLSFCLLIAGFGYALPAGAAPLDALLQVTGSGKTDRVEVEVGYDVVNDTIDVLDIRAKDEEFSGTHVGDYHGAHLRGRLNITESLSLDGAFWHRRLDYTSDQAQIDSWQIGLQHRFSETTDGWPALAWRLSAWGNESDELRKTSPTTVQGRTIDTVNVNSPQDRQAQLDLVASWALASRTTWSLFAGAGASRVKVEEINGTFFSMCPHRIKFRKARTIVTPSADCREGEGIRYNGPPISEFGGDVYSQANYTAKYLQAGTSVAWQGQQWRLAAGYQYQALDRGALDDRMAQQGRPVQDSNHTVVGEVRYRFNKRAQVFARAQAMAHQFVGEIPFAYNGYTSHRFNKRYGFVSTGLIINF